MNKKRVLSIVLVLCFIISLSITSFAAYDFRDNYCAQVWFTENDGKVNFELYTTDYVTHYFKIEIVLIKDGSIVGENTVTKNNATYFKVAASSAGVDTALAKFYIDGRQVSYLSQGK